MPSPCTDINRDRTVRLRTSPSWLPEKFRVRLSRIRIAFRPFPGERRFLRKKKPIAPSEWAPKNRVVTYGPLEGSRWDNDFMPHFRGIMDASFHPSVRMIGNIKVPQSGSSAGVETILGYIADRCPGSAFVVYPIRDTASNRCNDYLQPMFRRSPRLARLLTGVSDDMAALRIKLQTMLIYMGWSGSVTSLGNISAKYLVGDELDKWEINPSKKETTSYLLFLERYRSFKYGAKAWLSSTPTDVTGFIWKFMTEEAQVIFDYWITCPGCGEEQVLDFKQIKLLDEDERDPKAIKEKDLARYCCKHCGEMLTDRQRVRALRSGRWHARDDGREMWAYLRAKDPEKICFHSHALVTPLVSLNEIMARFFEGLKDSQAMRYYDTQIRAVAHVSQKQDRKEDAILALRDERPEGIVPGNGAAACLIATVDTQDTGFWYEIRAAGYGQTLESWGVRGGFVDSTAALENVLFDHVYEDADGNTYPVQAVLIDAMGHRTAEVYDLCRKYPGRMYPIKGEQRMQGYQSWSNIEFYPGTKKPIPGGMKLLRINASYYKDILAAKLNVSAADPGAWHLAASYTEAWAAQLCAEYIDDAGNWTCPSGRANHAFDLGGYFFALTDLLAVKFWPRPEERREESKPVQQQHEQKQSRW